MGFAAVGTVDHRLIAMALVLAFCVQWCIVLLNDYADRDADIAHQARFPALIDARVLVEGLLAPGQVLASGLLAAGGAVGDDVQGEGRAAVPEEGAQHGQRLGDVVLAADRAEHVHPLPLPCLPLLLRCRAAPIRQAALVGVALHIPPFSLHVNESVMILLVIMSSFKRLILHILPSLVNVMGRMEIKCKKIYVYVPANIDDCDTSVSNNSDNSSDIESSIIKKIQ